MNSGRIERIDGISVLPLVDWTLTPKRCGALKLPPVAKRT